jgi:hypothetical protein
MSDPNQPSVQPNLGSLDQQLFHQQFENLINPASDQPHLNDNQGFEISSQSSPASFDFLEDTGDPFSLDSHPPSHQQPKLQGTFNPFNSPQDQPPTDYTQHTNLNKDGGNHFDLLKQLETEPQMSQPLDQTGSQMVHSEQPKQDELAESLADFSSPHQPQLPAEKTKLVSNDFEQLITDSFKAEPAENVVVKSEPLSHEDQSSLCYDKGSNVGKEQGDILSSFEMDQAKKGHSQEDDNKDDVGIGKNMNAESKAREKMKPPGGDVLKSFENQVLPSQFTEPIKKARESTGLDSLPQSTSEQNLEQSKSTLTESSTLKMDPSEEPTSSESVSSSSPSSCCLCKLINFYFKIIFTSLKLIKQS